MKFYFAANMGSASFYDRLFQLHPHPRLLYSYWELNGELGKNKAHLYGFSLARQNTEVFVDSGAFSAFTHDSSIDISQYISYLQNIDSGIACAATLDVIGDHEATQQNYKEMTEHTYNFPILNVVHYGATAKQINEAIETTESGYIAVGGLVGTPQKKQVKFLDRFWSVAKNHFPIRVHAFGIATPIILKRYPFYSCDSTTAIVGGGLGRVINFEHGQTSWYTYKQKDKINHKTFGLVDDGKTHHIQRRIHNIIETQKMERYITQLWNKRGITWD